MNKLSLTGAAFALVVTATSVPAFAQDGDVERDRPAAKATKPLGCVEGAAFCPSFPRSLRVSREAFVAALHGLAGCADSEETAVEQQLRDAGDASAVSAALAHLILADPSLSLHDIKNAVDLIAASPSDDGLRALREVYLRSEALAGRTVERELDAESRVKVTRNQAEELRRIVVLAIAKDQSPAATALLREAESDGGRSVTIAASRALESRRAN